MHTKTTVMLAIASLLTVSATAMAAPASHRSHRAHWSESQTPFDARAEVQAPNLRYDPSTEKFESVHGNSDLLFDRAKGDIY
jgi:hypothetical protein